MKKFLFTLCTIFICTSIRAQTETTKWYIEGELYDTTTCESGGDITLPSLPERLGYAFDGWTPAIYDMSTLNKSINGSSYSRDESAKTWNVTFNYGIVYGEAFCSPTPNTAEAQNDGIVTTSNGQYCYCRVTAFKPSAVIYEPVASRWVFNGDLGSASNCASYCANRCGDNVQNGEAVRAGLFGSVAN